MTSLGASVDVLAVAAVGNVEGGTAVLPLPPCSVELFPPLQCCLSSTAACQLGRISTFQNSASGWPLLALGLYCLNAF